MLNRRIILKSTLAAALMLGVSSAALAQEVPAGYPASYADIMKAATAEGKLSIYTSTDQEQAQAFLDGFTKKYPGITIEYNDLGTGGAYNRAVSEFAAGQVGGDIIWTSAMDLQMVMVRDGMTEAYASAEKANVPAWGIFEDQIFATSVEPAGIIYNKNSLTEDKIPKTRPDLVKFLQAEKDNLKGKVASFDPEKSGTGFLYFTNDVRNTPDFWDLAKAFGAVQGKTYSSSGNMKEKVVSGEHAIAFNVIGSYALDWVKDNPGLGVVFPTDYVAAFSRTANILKGAPHPNAAKLFIDYILSKEGQTALATNGIPSIRADVSGEGINNVETLNKLVGGNLKPIPLDKGLLEYMDEAKRVEFFKQWKAAIGG